MRPRYVALSALALAASTLLPACGSSAEEKPKPSSEPLAAAVEPAPPAPTGPVVRVPDLRGGEARSAVERLEAGEVSVSLGRDDGRDPAGCLVRGQSAHGLLDADRDLVLDLDCRLADWRARDGEAWRLFDAAYVSG